MSKLTKRGRNPLIEEAWQKLETGRLEEALELFDEALVENKKDTEALYGRASANFLLDEPEKATKDLNTLLKINDAYQKGYHLRGLIKGSDKKYKDAIKDLKKAVSLSESNIEAMVDLGGAYLVEKDYASARAVFETVTKIHDECPDGWRGLGIAFLFEMKYDKAMEMLGKALEKDRNDLDSLLAMADACFASSNPEKGMEFAKKAKDIKKDIFNGNKKKSDYDEFENDDEEENNLPDTDFED